ncbi:MAG: Rrf2 family transcriptional regulator [Pigmentiphaga sp.]
MSFISAGVEYGLHCLLFLVEEAGQAAAPSSRDLAELQGIPAEFAAKIFTRLQKAGLIATQEGVRGGIRLARDPAAICVHDVVVAIDGDKPMFTCREIRRNCAVFEGKAPDWATDGLCGIHAVMRQAEQAMRDSLRATSLADLAGGLARKAPGSYQSAISDWLADRSQSRTGAKSRETKT